MNNIIYPLSTLLGLLAVMEIADLERIRELKLTAKWGIDNEEKKKAISELLQFRSEGASAIQEVLAITAFDDVKLACIDAIKSIGRKQQTASPHHKDKHRKAAKDNPKHVTRQKKRTIRKGKSKKAKS